MNSLTRFLTGLPYLGMVVGLSLGIWAFQHSDSYREETQDIWHETYHSLWRTMQVRDRLSKVHGLLVLANKTGEVGSDLADKISVLELNIQTVLDLSYLPRVFSQAEITRFEDIKKIVEEGLAPSALKQKNYAIALHYADEVERHVHEITGAHVNHNKILQEAAHINMIALRNWFLFALGLGLISILYLVINQRFNFARQSNQHLRSFASLFVHTTRTHIAGLRLFLSKSHSDFTGSMEMLKAAREAVEELGAINESLVTISYAKHDPDMEPLGALLKNVVANRNNSVRLEIGAGTEELPLPATQFRLLATELIQNAETASTGVADASIVVSASIRQRGFFGGKYLALEVRDNGKGMSVDLRRNAITPFFSTKAEGHGGLGLTACAEMAATLNGDMTIDSVTGKGTSVLIQIPLKAKMHAAKLASPSLSRIQGSVE